MNTTTNATDVRCPTCGAAEGRDCRVPFKNIRTNAPHAERVSRALESSVHFHDTDFAETGWCTCGATAEIEGVTPPAFRTRGAA